MSRATHRSALQRYHRERARSELKAANGASSSCSRQLHLSLALRHEVQSYCVYVSPPADHVGDVLKKVFRPTWNNHCSWVGSVSGEPGQEAN